MRAPAELTELFRERGLKITPQRQLIFRLLHGDDAHPTADTVWARARHEMPAISLRTVYQTLNDLAEMGEIQALDLGTGSARFDPNVEHPHHHLVCEGCGKVRDVHVDVEGVEVPATELHGFTVGSAEVVFRGRCAECAARPAPATAPGR